MTLNEILSDPGISYWLKDAIKTAYERDPVDALQDARRLLKMLGERYTQIVNRVDRHVPGRVKLVAVSESAASDLPEMRVTMRMRDAVTLEGIDVWRHEAA
jgi:hypothetical protein